MASCLVDSCGFMKKGPGPKSWHKQKRRFWISFISFPIYSIYRGSAVAQWLRYRATNRKVAGSTMRIESLEPHRQWTLIWKNLWNAPITMHKRVMWYHIIHDILPTNCRLHNIGMAPTDACHNCGGRDTVVHRLIEYDPGPEQWDWMKTRIAAILFMDKKWILDHWILRPQITVWPPQRRRAILWSCYLLPPRPLVVPLARFHLPPWPPFWT
jgi:hypothetical protein